MKKLPILPLILIALGIGISVGPDGNALAGWRGAPALFSVICGLILWRWERNARERLEPLFAGLWVLVLMIWLAIVVGCAPAYPYKGADGHHYRVLRRASYVPNGTIHDVTLYERKGDTSGRRYILLLGQPEQGGTYVSTTP